MQCLLCYVIFHEQFSLSFKVIKYKGSINENKPSLGITISVFHAYLKTRDEATKCKALSFFIKISLFVILAEIIL